MKVRDSVQTLNKELTLLTYLVFTAAFLIILTLICTPIWRARRRHTLETSAFPLRWHELLKQRWLQYSLLPKDVLLQVQQQIQVMMADTEFYGCNDLEVTEEMRLLVLAQASLLYGNVVQDRLSDFPHVLLYPDAFINESPRANEFGVVSNERHVLLGESWQQGKVILAWADIEKNLLQLNGHNLVIHEYAHQVDGYDGAMNGTPPLAGRSAFESWPRVMQAAYDDVCRHVNAGDHSFEPYATTNPAEFFAVICEYFFTLPHFLMNRYPEVYRLLAQLYQLDPLQWPQKQ